MTFGIMERLALLYQPFFQTHNFLFDHFDCPHKHIGCRSLQRTRPLTAILYRITSVSIKYIHGTVSSHVLS